MDAAQSKFLKGRFKEAVTYQPELKQLRTLLLRVGGTFLVPPARPDPDISALLTNGFVMSGPVTVKKLERSMCHQNVSAIWKTHRFGVIGIATGYALSGDDLWRQHSWCILRDGLLETTTERVKYFGILLQGAHADQFAAENP